MELHFKDEPIPSGSNKPYQDEKTEGGEELIHITESLDDMRLKEEEGSNIVSSSKNTT